MELDFGKYKAYQFCENSECEFFEEIGEGNIGIKSSKNHQVYCKGCGDYWVITKKTFFYNLKTPVDTILSVLKLLSEGMGVNAVCRSTGVTADSIRFWILRAARHVNELNAYLQQEMSLTQCQIDEFWSFIYKKKETLEKRKLGKMKEETGGAL